VYSKKQSKSRQKKAAKKAAKRQQKKTAKKLAINTPKKHIATYTTHMLIIRKKTS
jgi:hypothetical protein